MVFKFEIGFLTVLSLPRGDLLPEIDPMSKSRVKINLLDYMYFIEVAPRPWAPEATARVTRALRAHIAPRRPRA